MRNMEKIASIAVAGVLALGLFPAMGLAAESSGVSVEIRTIQWVSTQDRPDFEETIDVAGVEYTLRGEPAVKEIGSVTCVKISDTEAPGRRWMWSCG